MISDVSSISPDFYSSKLTVNPMKWIYYLVSIGNPNINIKLKILQKNLEYMYNNINKKFSIIINCYDCEEEVREFINKFDFLENIYFYFKKGVLTELWLTNPYNIEMKNYDYILFILDDVCIKDIDFEETIKIKNKYKIDIVSPRINNSTHPFMNNLENGLTFTNVLEIYCLFLTYDNFLKYASINTIENKWMWGVDFMFGYFKIKTAIINKFKAVHILPSLSNHKEAYRLCNQYLQKYGFNSLEHIKIMYPCIIEYKNI